MLFFGKLRKDKINKRKPGRTCSLCNIERLEKAFADKKSSLNYKTELIGKSRAFAKICSKSYHYIV